LRVGRTKGQKSGRKPKRCKRGNGCHSAHFRSSLALHAVEKFRMKGGFKSGIVVGEREGELGADFTSTLPLRLIEVGSLQLVPECSATEPTFATTSSNLFQCLGPDGSTLPSVIRIVDEVRKDYAAVDTSEDDIFK
jgi:hypothetical protein